MEKHRAMWVGGWMLPNLTMKIENSLHFKLNFFQQNMCVWPE